MTTPKPTYRDGLRADTRRIAHDILKKEGIAALQARRVAQEAGCSVGTLYNLYQGLDDLIVSANAITLAELGAALEASGTPDSSDASLEERLLGLATAYLGFAIDNHHSWRAIFEHRLTNGRSVPDWYRDAQAQLFAIVEADIAAYVPAGEDRRRAARALFGAVHGIVSLALDEKLGAFDRASCEAEVRFIIRAAARGLESPSSGFANNHTG